MLKKKSVLIVAPLDLSVSGNCTTARRIASLLGSFYDVTCQGCKFIAASPFRQQPLDHRDNQRQRQMLLPPTFRYDCVIGLHALRTAKWLLEIEGAYLTAKLGYSLPPLPREICAGDNSERQQQQQQQQSHDSSLEDEFQRQFQLDPGLPSQQQQQQQQHDVEDPSPIRRVTAPPQPLLKPLVLIFGGTDVNESSKDPSDVALMKVAVDRASKCVCFSDDIRDTALRTWGSAIAGKLVVIPQTVDDEFWAHCHRLLRVAQYAQAEEGPPADRDKHADDEVAPPQPQPQLPPMKRPLELGDIDEEEDVGELERVIVEAQQQQSDKSHNKTLIHADSVRRWIVMPAGVRRVKNQAQVLELLVALNKLSMRSELDDIEKGQERSLEHELEVANEGDRKKRRRLRRQHESVSRSIAAADEDFTIPEWGLLLLGPSIEDDYAQCVEDAAQKHWFGDHKLHLCSHVVWHRTGVSTARLAKLLFERTGKKTSGGGGGGGGGAVSVVINASRSEGQPQAIMEAMVVTATQRRKELQDEMSFFDGEATTQARPYLGYPGFVCAVTDCPGNLAVADESCAVVLPLAHDDDVVQEWARRIQSTVGDVEAVFRLRSEASRRAMDTMQSMNEMDSYMKIIGSLTDDDDDDGIDEDL